MNFDEWMKTVEPKHKPTDDSVTLRLLRKCWAAAQAAQREQCAAAVLAMPTHTWVDGSDQWGRPCPAKVVTTREQYAQACERA